MSGARPSRGEPVSGLDTDTVRGGMKAVSGGASHSASQRFQKSLEK